MRPTFKTTIKATFGAVLLPLALSVPAMAQSATQGAASAQQSTYSAPSYLVGGGGNQNSGTLAGNLSTDPNAERAATGISEPWYRPGDYGYTPETHGQR